MNDLEAYPKDLETHLKELDGNLNNLEALMNIIEERFMQTVKQQIRQVIELTSVAKPSKTIKGFTYNIKLVFIGVFLALGSIAWGQTNDFITRKVWELEIQGYAWHWRPTVSLNALHQNGKNRFFGGIGLYSMEKQVRPDLKLGYRKYPFSNRKSVKFFYQTFLYYAQMDNYINDYYITLNLGVGLAYHVTPKISVGLSANLGSGICFSEGRDGNHQIFTAFPALLSLSYKFQNEQPGINQH